MTGVSNTPWGPPGATVTWCPHCHEPIHVGHRAHLIDYGTIEARTEEHFATHHRVRWWLWQKFGWKRAISGL